MVLAAFGSQPHLRRPARPCNTLQLDSSEGKDHIPKLPKYQNVSYGFYAGVVTVALRIYSVFGYLDPYVIIVDFGT